jgi:hypothetical protein
LHIWKKKNKKIEENNLNSIDENENNLIPIDETEENLVDLVIKTNIQTLKDIKKKNYFQLCYDFIEEIFKIKFIENNDKKEDLSILGVGSVSTEKNFHIQIDKVMLQMKKKKKLIVILKKKFNF